MRFQEFEYLTYRVGTCPDYGDASETEQAGMNLSTDVANDSTQKRCPTPVSQVFKCSLSSLSSFHFKITLIDVSHVNCIA